MPVIRSVLRMLVPPKSSRRAISALSSDSRISPSGRVCGGVNDLRQAVHWNR